MPEKAEHFCNWSGCDELTQSRYCTKHQAEYDKKVQQDKQAYSKTRQSSAKRGYDDDWRRLRGWYLSGHSLCEDCKDKGLIVAAEMVHHVVPINDGGKRLDASNLRSLCNSCHEERHRYDRWKRRVEK